MRTSAQPDSALWGDIGLFGDRRSIRIQANEAGEQWEYAVRAKAETLEAKQHGLLQIAVVLISVAAALAMYWLLSHRSELERTALYDTLTGLPNRRLLSDRLGLALARKRRSDNLLAILFIDLNGFNEINDRHGHKAGDRLLAVVGRRIHDELRGADTVARWGGDEFVVVLESLTPPSLGQLIARIRKTINQPVKIDSTEVSVRAAIGTATTAADGEDAQRLLTLADERMYVDKQRLKDGGADQRTL